MKRHIVILFAVAALVAAATVYAEDGPYPPELFGRWLDLNGVETTMLYTHASGLEFLPWSMPDPTGVEVPVIFRANEESAQLILTWLGRVYEMTWIEDAGCYAQYTLTAPNEIRFVAITGVVYPGNRWTAVFWDASLVFLGHPPMMWEFDPFAPLITAQINPHGDPAGMVARHE